MNDDRRTETILGTGPRARIEKDRTTNRWRCTVAIGQGCAFGEFDTFEQALAGRYVLIAAIAAARAEPQGTAL